MTPGLGRFSGEGIGYPLQGSWTFLVAQLVKNPWETQLRSLGGEDPLEKGKATHSCSGLESSMDGIVIVHGVAKSLTRLSDFHFPTLLPHIGLCPRDESTEQKPLEKGRKTCKTCREPDFKRAGLPE